MWDNWKDPDSGEWLRTFTILTTRPNELVAPLHERMPVVLPPDGFDRWLGEDPDPRDLIAPFPADAMIAWRVSRRVNKVENNDADVLAPTGSAA